MPIASQFFSLSSDEWETNEKAAEIQLVNASCKTCTIRDLDDLWVPRAGVRAAISTELVSKYLS
jgi:hypothetical protein